MKFLLLVLGGAIVSSAAPPTPASHFGHAIGADRQLLDWDRVTRYFEALAASSDKIRVAAFGKSAEGRPLVVATIASPDTLRELDRYLSIQRGLADSRITTPADAERLLAAGKNVVLITCSIHATEVASTQTAAEFAYRLITEDTPRFRAILANDIVLLVPSLNPDGLDLVTRWYRRTLGTAYEGTAPPELYQKYLGHDNNRDWYIFSQPETRAVVSELLNRWRPEIVYDVHQQGPHTARMSIPPWLDPIEPNVDAILAQEMNMIGTSMASDMTAAGFLGISIHSTYDFWSPARAYSAFHGGLRILTESASARLATPVEVSYGDLQGEALGYNARQRSWNFLEPWPGGRWTLRDIIDYQEAAFESCLYQAAIHREEMLRAFYRVGVRAVERAKPAAFVFPAAQQDPGALRRLLETLAFGQVEIQRARDGSHVISMHQPYSSYAKALLERQEYPDRREYPGGPPQRPYDVTTHCLPLLFGVEALAVNEVESGGLVPETQFAAPPPSLRGSDTDTWEAVNRLWNEGRKVWRDSVSGDFDTRSHDSAWREISRPRVALYRSWIPSMDEGWTRWLLEHFGFRFSRVTNDDIQRGQLREHFDTIVFPDQDAEDLTEGYKPGAMPEEYTGGLGGLGARALRGFAESGGTLVFLNRSTAYAARAFALPISNAVERLPDTRYYSPGSLLNVKLARGHPLTRGLPESIPIWSEQSPAWAVTRGSVAQYPSDRILASGWLLGSEFLAGRSALLDVKLGRGHAILFGMRPQYRAQSYQAFKLFFNALLYHD